MAIINRHMTTYVIGAGVSGLTAAIYLARAGLDVTVLEARPSAGGTASGFVANSLQFDENLSFIWDKPLLAGSFRQIGYELDDHVEFERVENVFEVFDQFGESTKFYSSLEQTIEELEEQEKNSGLRYRAFVDCMIETRRDLLPVFSGARATKARLFSSGVSHRVSNLQQSFDDLLVKFNLPRQLRGALSVLPRMRGLHPKTAPAQLALNLAMIHREGIYAPSGGTGNLCKVLTSIALTEGVTLRLNAKVTRIAVEAGKVERLVLQNGESIKTSSVVSSCGGLNTYLILADAGLSRSLRQQLNHVPLESPGVCAYMTVRGGDKASSYLNFHIPEQSADTCHMFVRPWVSLQDLSPHEWQPAKLIASLPHHEAEQLGHSGQSELLAQLLHQKWWRAEDTQYRLIATRTPSGWGREYSLYRDSAGPAESSIFESGSDSMAHRSPFIQGLYLCGRSTRPGNSLSYRVRSGILAAKKFVKDC